MQYTDLIKRGFEIANRNWQLVIVQIGGILLNLFALLALVGIPVLVLAAVMGIEASRAGDLYGLLEGHAPDLEISQYLGAILVIAVSFFAYLTAALVIWLMVAGGSAGILGRAACNAGFRFGMGSFWEDARRFFWPLAWYYTIISAIFLVVATLLSVGAGAAVMGYDSMGLEDTRLGVFFAVMGILILGACALFFLACLFLLSVQGLAPIVIEGCGAWAGIRRAWNFLDQDRKGLYLLLIASGGFMAIQITLGIFGGILQAIPLLGIIVYLPYSLATNILGIYLNLALMSTVFFYYAQAEAGAGGSISPGSIAAESISPPQEPWREPPPPYQEPPL